MDGPPTMRVKMQLNKLSASFFGNSPSKDSDPAYLWVVFFKIDGDTTSVIPANSTLQLQGTATVIPMPGNHGDLVLNEGLFYYTVPPEVGAYVFQLNAIPVPSVNMTIPGMVGCAAIAMDQNGTPDDAVAAGHAALNTAVQQQLNNLIPTFSLSNLPTPQNLQSDAGSLTSSVQSQVVNAMAKQMGTLADLWALLGLSDQDSPLLTAIFMGIQNGTADPPTVIDLTSVPAQGSAMQFKVTDSGGGAHPSTSEIELDAWVYADPFPLSLKRIYTGLGNKLPVDIGNVTSGSIMTWLFTA